MATPRSYDAFVADIPDPALRAKALFCLIVLEILHRLLATLNGDPCPVQSRLHARLMAGQDFGLSARQLADLRTLIAPFQTLLPPASPPRRAACAAAIPTARRHTAPARPHTAPARTIRPARHYPNPAQPWPPPDNPAGAENALLPGAFRTPISFRLRN